MTTTIRMLLLSLAVVAFTNAHVFKETFETMSAWSISSAPEFTGEWSIGPGPLPYQLVGETGLIVGSAARRHAIATGFDSEVPVHGKDLVLQYEVRLHNHLECGGAYIKALAGTQADNFDHNSKYSIMFGPDKCGTTDKVHLIFKHQNPVTKEWTEHHLQNPPTVVNDRFTHLYTLEMYKNNTFNILIDGQMKKTGSLLSSTDFKPSVIPPMEIDDPTDKKPDTWVDAAKIPDPKATKPDDWDEDAPATIIDTKATKPDDWDESAPTQIPDPDAVKPEDWSDEDDGEWEALLIDNPACSKGCGKWTAPSIPNPDYKGKWTAPMIDNPDYVGPWSPKQIPNPAYFTTEDATEGIAPLVGAGFEIWTMQDNIEFDNIYIGHDPEKAKEFAEQTWKLKNAAEKEQYAEISKKEEASKPADKSEQESQAEKILKAVRPYLDILNDNPYPFFGTFAAGLVAIVLYLWKSGGPAADDLREKAKQQKEVVEKSSSKKDLDGEQEDGVVDDDVDDE